MAEPRDFYEVLGVSREASADEIKRAYRKQAAANHPDRNPGDEEALQRFKAASEAHEVLSDPDKRARYDRFGHAGLQGGAGGGFGDMGDIASAFGDMLEGFFGGSGRGGGGRGRGVERGADLQLVVRMTLRDAFTGCKKAVEIQRDELCGTCHGSGAAPGSTPQKCDYCSGRGFVVQSLGGLGISFQTRTNCPQCRGAGKVIRDKCKPCSGRGRERKPFTIDVSIPAGVDNGMQLRVRGEGEPSPNGGPRGDLFCVIEVSQDTFFRREGLNLLCTVPITFSQAALGGEIEIPLVDGKQMLNIAAGTQPGDVLRLRGKGMPEPQSPRRGDLLVTMQVDVPKKLTKRQEELLRELADLDTKHVTPHRKSFFDQIKAYFTGQEDED